MLRKIASSLSSGGIEAASSEALRLLEAAAGRSYAELVSAGEPIDAATSGRSREMAARRVAGEPLQYITGVAGFRRLELAVGPGVLVPRPETEVVTERAMTRLPHGGTLLDVGTGSGAIALAVKDERTDARVFATESSPDAFVWAVRNRASLGLEIHLIESDLFSGLPAEMSGAIDVVVSNPPYVADNEAGLLPSDVVDHEPHEALFAGPDGLGVITRLAEEARTWLATGGWLVLEIGADQGRSVRELLARAGYVDVAVHMDLVGRERIVEGRRLG